MRDNLSTIKEKDTVPLAGLMVESMLVNGRLVSSTVKEPTSVLIIKGNQASGKMARKSSG